MLFKILEAVWLPANICQTTAATSFFSSFSRHGQVRIRREARGWSPPTTPFLGWKNLKKREEEKKNRRKKKKEEMSPLYIYGLWARFATNHSCGGHLLHIGFGIATASVVGIGGQPNSSLVNRDRDRIRNRCTTAQSIPCQCPHLIGYLCRSRIVYLRYLW